MLIKGRTSGISITPEIQSQDAEELPQRHSMRQNQHIIGCCSIHMMKSTCYRKPEIKRSSIHVGSIRILKLDY
jgi:hypothetical protein